MRKNYFLLLVIIPVLLIPVYAQESEYTIPSWIKVVAGAWANDTLTDSEYQEAMKFLIENKIIIIEGYGKIQQPVVQANVTSLEEPESLIVKVNNSQVQIETIMVESEIQVSTDKPLYTSDDKITISGSIKTLAKHAQSVTIIIVDSNKKAVDIAQVIPESNGSFSHIVDNDKITIQGEYTVKIQYQNYKITSNFNFE